MQIKITPSKGQTAKQFREHLEQWQKTTNDTVNAIQGPEGDRLRAKRAKAHEAAEKICSKIVIVDERKNRPFKIADVSFNNS